MSTYWIIAITLIAFVVGVVVGVAWANIAISNHIRRRFGIPAQDEELRE